MNEIFTSMTRASIVRSCGDIMSAQVDNSYVLMGIRQGRFFGFNEIGDIVWPLLQRSISIGELCETLHKRFDADSSVIEADLIAFIADLLKNGFVEVTA